MVRRIPELLYAGMAVKSLEVMENSPGASQFLRGKAGEDAAPMGLGGGYWIFYYRDVAPTALAIGH